MMTEHFDGPGGRMRIVVVTLVLVGASVVLGQNPNLITRYLRNNPAVVRRQLNCLLNYGPCDANGSRLRAAMPSIVSTNCASCSPLVSTIVSYIGTAYPQEYQQIRSLYG